MRWNEQPTTCVGAVLFRGKLPPQADEFAFLAQRGIEVRTDEKSEAENWALRLSHPQWGDARLSALPKSPAMGPIAKFDSRLDPIEKGLVGLGESSVVVRVEGSRGNVLRDRKFLLRFLDAVMGNDGLIALDITATRFWSRPALADELCHDADLDIDALFTIHAVQDDKNPKRLNWAHTHGLGEIGFFDFDIIKPHPDLLSARCHDLFRAIAFSIVEKKVEKDTKLAKLVSTGPLRFVDVKEFSKHATGANSSMRDKDAFHNRNRAVLCEPVNAGYLSKWFGVPANPARFLQGEPGDFIVYFPTDASRLMAERAVKTFKMFRGFAEEFADLHAKPLAKIGYRVDGGTANDLEHLWFEVHGFTDDAVDATLLNQPANVSGLKQGERKMHPVSQLTDWMLVTPVGAINPRDTRPARTARTNRDKIIKLLEQKRG